MQRGLQMAMRVSSQQKRLYTYFCRAMLLVQGGSEFEWKKAGLISPTLSRLLGAQNPRWSVDALVLPGSGFLAGSGISGMSYDVSVGRLARCGLPCKAGLYPGVPRHERAHLRRRVLCRLRRLAAAGRAGAGRGGHYGVHRHLQASSCFACCTVLRCQSNSRQGHGASTKGSCMER